MAKAVLKAKATLDNKQFKTGVQQMNQGVNRFANGQLKQMAGLIGGAFAVGVIINFGKELLSTADALDNTSRQIGIGVESLQALRRETELTAGSADKMDSTLRKLAKSMANAVAGESEQVDGFKDLGISMEEVTANGGDVGRIFEKIAIKVSGASLASKEASGASKILGRNYVELNTVMDTLADVGLENLKQQMLDTNQIMSEDTARAADIMEESFNRIGRSITTTFQEATVSTVNYFDKLTTVMARMEGMSIGKRAKFFSKALSSPAEFLAEILGTAAGETGGFGTEDSASSKPKVANRTAGADNAVKAPRIAAVKAADSIAKIGGIIGAQSSTRTASQKMDQSLMVQRSSMVALEEIKKNTAPIREGA